MTTARRPFRLWWIFLLVALLSLVGWLNLNRVTYPLSLEHCVADTGVPYRVSGEGVQASLWHEMKVTSWCG